MTSCRPSRRASLPSHERYHSSARISPARGRALPRARFWSWSPGISDRAFVSGNGRISYVPGEPLVLLPCSPTPAGPTASGLFQCHGAAPAASTTKAPACIAFEAQSHGFGTRCLRFAGRVAPTPRKTRFRLLAKLFRTGLLKGGRDLALACGCGRLAHDIAKSCLDAVGFMQGAWGQRGAEAEVNWHEVRSFLKPPHILV
jgi:hypothetical protein